MNDLVFYSLILLFFVRIIGLGASITFFYDSRKKRYIYFILGWAMSALGTLFPIFSEITRNPLLSGIFLVLNSLLVSIGLFYLVIGLFSYFIRINLNHIIFLSLIITITPFLIYILIGYQVAILFSVFSLNLILIVAFIIPLVKLKIFKQKVGKSFRWYYVICASTSFIFPISYYTYVQGYSYGLYNSENHIIIILNYSMTIINYLLLIILLVHLEYGFTYVNNYDLKDKYSHSLGNILQAISGAAFLINDELEKEEVSELKNLIQSKAKEASNLIEEIREL